MMGNQGDGRVPQAEPSCEASPSAGQEAVFAKSHPSRDVAAVVSDLSREFGPGFSNGVVAILAHRELPPHFGKNEWADWLFKPADKAFEWAHNRGLIVPLKLSSKWAFTRLGRAVAEHFQAALCDTDTTGAALAKAGAA
jgi:hypothetical protein